MVVVAPVYEMHGQDSLVRDVGEVCTTVSATYGSGGGNVPITLAQSIPFDTTQITSPYNYSNPQAGDPCHPLAARAHVPAVVQPIPLNSMNCFRSPEADPSTGCGVGEQGEAMFTISKTNHHAVAQPIAWDEELNPSVDIAGTLLRGGADGRHDGVAQPIVYERHDQDARLKEVSVAPTLHAKSDNTCDLPVVLHPNTAVAYNISPGKGELKDDIHVTDAHVSKTIDASNSNPAMHQGGVAIVSPTLTASNDPSRSPQSTEVTNQVAAIHAVSMAVRRLMPVECERLQGFPDNYTNIPWRKKPESPDGPRYKALGNSWAVPVVAWIGKRIHEAVQ
jgi:hypothetical protein